MTISRLPARISIFGLGYVGAVTAACLAERGHHVIGVDVRQAKVDLINDGKSPIVERGIDDLIAKQVREGRLSATVDSRAAVLQSELSLICVGTPSLATGGINTCYVEAVAREIGEALIEKTDYHTILLRSTVLPGITRGIVLPLLERHSGKNAGTGFGICFNPEFLREATAIDDFNNPSKTVIGQFDERSGDAAIALYQDMPGPVLRTNIETAEMTKYADNAWHALKICFANEIGTLSKSVKVDSHEVMSIFCQDTKLNLSAYYLKPGFAFGGSCLPKDVRAINSLAHDRDIQTPLLDAIHPSNDAHQDRAIKIIRDLGIKRVGILGLTFKAGTDDMRESPAVKLLQALRVADIDVRFFDEGATSIALTGENRQFLLERIPDFEALAVADVSTLSAQVDALVVTQNTLTYRNAVRDRRNGQVVVDLVHLGGHGQQRDYHLLC